MIVLISDPTYPHNYDAHDEFAAQLKRDPSERFEKSELRAVDPGAGSRIPWAAATAKQLGLPVSTDMPSDVLDLMKLYPQPMRQQRGGGVEYLPVPRQREAVRRGSI